MLIWEGISRKGVSVEIQYVSNNISRVSVWDLVSDNEKNLIMDYSWIKEVFAKNEEKEGLISDIVKLSTCSIKSFL